MTLAGDIPQILFRRSTNVVELQRVRDRIARTYPTNLTMVATVFDASGNSVSGAMDIPMPYVAGTTGVQTTYRGLIEDNVLLPGARYTCVVTITGPGNVVRTFNQALIALDG